MSQAARAIRLHALQDRARRATAHAGKLADYIQRKLDEGAEPAWYMLRELDRRHDAMLTALAELAAAEAEIAAAALGKRDDHGTSAAAPPAAQDAP